MVEVAQVGERFDESMRFLQNPWMSFPLTLLPLTAHDIFFLLFCQLWFFHALFSNSLLNHHTPQFILSITKRWPKGNKNTVRPCCTWMEVGRPAIRWSSGRYGIHKVWIEAMKMWCLFFSGSDKVICSSKWKHCYATVFSVSIQIGYFWDKGASGVMKSILLSGVFSGPHFAECAACRLWGRLFSGVRLMIWERTYISENLKCNTQHLSDILFSRPGYGYPLDVNYS